MTLTVDNPILNLRLPRAGALLALRRGRHAARGERAAAGRLLFPGACAGQRSASFLCSPMSSSRSWPWSTRCASRRGPGTRPQGQAGGRGARGRGRAASAGRRVAGNLLETSPFVVAYTRTDHMGFSIPYTFAGGGHNFFPDFLVRLRPAHQRNRPCDAALAAGSGDDGLRQRPAPQRSAPRAVELFPFDVAIGASQIMQSPRLQVYQQGQEMTMVHVVWKGHAA